MCVDCTVVWYSVCIGPCFRDYKTRCDCEKSRLGQSYSNKRNNKYCTTSRNIPNSCSTIKSTPSSAKAVTHPKFCSGLQSNYSDGEVLPRISCGDGTTAAGDTVCCSVALPRCGSRGVVPPGGDANDARFRCPPPAEVAAATICAAPRTLRARGLWLWLFDGPRGGSGDSPPRTASISGSFGGISGGASRAMLRLPPPTSRMVPSSRSCTSAVHSCMSSRPLGSSS